MGVKNMVLLPKKNQIRPPIILPTKVGKYKLFLKKPNKGELSRALLSSVDKDRIRW